MKFLRASALVVVAYFLPLETNAQVTKDRSTQSADVRVAQSCVADPTAPITLYGGVPPAGLVPTELSLVQIFPASETTTAYLQQIENNLNGIPPTPPPGAASNPNYLSEALAQARAFADMPRIAKNAPILHTGQFICRGFTPGKYELFATVYTVGTTAGGGSGKSFVTRYYRSTVLAPSTRKKVLIGVPGFHLVGQVPR